MSDMRDYFNAGMRAHRQGRTIAAHIAIMEEWCVAPMYVKPGLDRIVRLEDVSAVIHLERVMQQVFRKADATGDMPAFD